MKTGSTDSSEPQWLCFFSRFCTEQKLSDTIKQPAVSHVWYNILHKCIYCFQCHKPGRCCSHMIPSCFVSSCVVSISSMSACRWTLCHITEYVSVCHFYRNAGWYVTYTGCRVFWWSHLSEKDDENRYVNLSCGGQGYLIWWGHLWRLIKPQASLLLPQDSTGCVCVLEWLCGVFAPCAAVHQHPPAAFRLRFRVQHSQTAGDYKFSQ